MNGEVDDSGRALLTLGVRRDARTAPVDVEAWIDTGFTGELVMPRPIIEQFQLPQSSVVTATFADGSEIVLDAYDCIIEWFGKSRRVEVIENDGVFPLLGVGLLIGHRLEIDYSDRAVTVL